MVLKPNPPHCADDVKISGVCASVVLPHVINVQSELLIECVSHPDSGAVSHPIVQTPIVKNFVRNKPGEFCRFDIERMFQPDAIAVAPRIDLWIAPTPFKPIAISKSELP